MLPGAPLGPGGEAMTVRGAPGQLRIGALIARLAGAIALLTILTATVGKLLLTPTGDGMAQPFDDAIRTWSRSQLIGVRPMAATLGAVGSTIAIAVVAVLLTASLWSRSRDAERALLPVTSVMVASAVGALTKVLVARARPGGVEVGLLEIYSFPSGHTEAATALALGSYLVWRTGRTVRASGVAAVVVFVTGAVVAVGRVVLDVHWASDVIAGAAVGAASTAAARWSLRRSRRTAPSDPEPPPVDDDR